MAVMRIGGARPALGSIGGFIAGGLGGGLVMQGFFPITTATIRHHLRVLVGLCRCRRLQLIASLFELFVAWVDKAVTLTRF